MILIVLGRYVLIFRYLINDYEEKYVYRNKMNVLIVGLRLGDYLCCFYKYKVYLLYLMKVFYKRMKK